MEPLIEDLGSVFLRKEGSFLIARWYFVSRVFLLLLIIWLVYLFVSKISSTTIVSSNKGQVTLLEANNLCSISRDKVDPWLYMTIISRYFSLLKKN